MKGHLTEVTIDGVVYPTIAAAADVLGYTPSGLQCRIRRGDTTICDKTITVRDTGTPAGSQAVRCVETGEVFVSMQAADRAMNKPYGTIRRAILNGYPVDGLNWKHV